MEEQVQEHGMAHDMTEHYRTYSAFLAGVVAHIFGAVFVLVALITFAFGNTFSTILGWATIVVGGAAILIDLRSANRNWRYSLTALAVLGVLTAINLS
jgi:hypothetical protein